MSKQTYVPEPLFDSTRKALTFALNHSVALPRPTMNKMMAEKTTPPKVIELADGTKIVLGGGRKMAGARPQDGQLRGLEGAATAGFILQQLASLPDHQQMIVIARSVVPTTPCACRSPCCMGYRPNLRWQRPQERLCEHLMLEAEVSKIKGKKGLSTGPELRSALVTKYLVPAREITLAEIAIRCGVTEQTVHNHKRPIFEYLTAQEDLGWAALDVLLSVSGIVGFLA